MGIFRWVVTIATVILIKLLLEKCEKFIYKYHERRLKSYKFFVGQILVLSLIDKKSVKGPRSPRIRQCRCYY